MDEAVKMKTRKPSNKQPKPVSQDVVMQEPDIEDLVVKRMPAMRDAKGHINNERIQALIAQVV